VNNFYLQHGVGTCGPFRTESVRALESPMARPVKRGSVVPTRFVVRWRSRWFRVYSDHAPGLTVPHFINTKCERIYVTGVSP
jgi:hypothetical protein